MIEVELADLGIIEYSKALEQQNKVFEELLNNPQKPGSLLYCQHPHVYTLGKNGSRENLLIGDEFLKKISATYFKIDRGGDITYHGYGQLVGYPIINISLFSIGLRDYIFLLEQAIIETIKKWGIESFRVPTATGVWVKDSSEREKKICAIGVKASRYVTMHGFALNVNTNLDYFKYINPCGFTDKQATSIKEICNEEIDFEEVKSEFTKQFALQFNCKIR